MPASAPIIFLTTIVESVSKPILGKKPKPLKKLSHTCLYAFEPAIYTNDWSFSSLNVIDLRPANFERFETAIYIFSSITHRVGVDFTGAYEGADPASVIFDGITKAKEKNTDVVLIDTAGRLQNKTNLMNELEKINRVIGKLIEEAPHETLLVISLKLFA